MSTINRETKRVLPPLVDGERLDRRTFHERYEAMPPGTRAELIGGVVVMPSPVSKGHSRAVILLAGWLNRFERGVAGLSSGCDATTLLDDQAEVQPDLQLYVLPEYGGQTRHDPDYVAGAPELVIEVARSGKRIDLGPKRADYERAGVLEYLVVTLDPQEVHWFGRQGDHFEPLPSGPDGLYSSVVFPGLWLDPTALFADDLDALAATIDRGKATPEHAAFAADLTARRPNP
jgi:Uma2 family endonuclease